MASYEIAHIQEVLGIQSHPNDQKDLLYHWKPIIIWLKIPANYLEQTHLGCNPW